jgi:hypothetical protein
LKLKTLDKNRTLQRYLKHVNMTKKAYRKLIAGHLQWSVLGLFIALVVAFITSDHRTVVYGGTGAVSGVSTVSEVPAPTSSAPASAPSPLTPKGGIKMVPDTINGELVWPDPWDKITDSPVRNY